jgi:alpha-glucosidase
MIDNHEPAMPTGLQRTYPNLMTQEGVRGQEFNAWSQDGGNPPEHTTIVPFTRGLAGPMDYTFGTFNFENTAVPGTRVRTTIAKQLALYVVIYSPLQMASDLPKNYKGKKEFDFIKAVPVDWTITKVLEARIGDYIATARKDRHSEEWYLGCITDEYSREITIDLNFLDTDKTYKAEIYKDGANADWETNPNDFEYMEMIVKSSESLLIKMANSGGQAVRFVPID